MIVFLPPRLLYIDIIIIRSINCIAFCLSSSFRHRGLFIVVVNSEIRPPVGEEEVEDQMRNRRKELLLES